MGEMRKWLIAQYWRFRALVLWNIGQWKPPEWDCDVRRDILLKEMKASGLVAGIDFVGVWGDVDGARHCCLELFKKWRIDPAAPGVEMTNVWKGTYQKVPNRDI